MDISEKIKKTLECRIRLTERLCDSLCSKCQFSVPELSYKEIYNVVLNYIQQLEHENKDLLEERELNEHLRDKVKQLEAAHRTEYCEEADYDCKALGEARKRIAELEAIDAEPVVRCKDCKHYNGHRWCLYFADSVHDDDYCSYGAKMDLEVQDEQNV